jgi:hypothetical protein
VCDIGSGTGCTGLAAACLGATVTLTDQRCVFPLLEGNVATAIKDCHLDEEKICVAEYNWGEDVSHLQAPFDLVLVSDCVLPKLYPIEPLVQVRQFRFADVLIETIIADNIYIYLQI